MELVASMKNENSGTPAKLRTYGPLAAAVLGVKCHPANDGGATVDLSSETMDYAKHTTGFYVGGLMENINIPAGSRASAYGRALGVIWAATDGKGLAGFWYNPEADVIEAEASEWIADRSEALSLAQRRGERAIYDIAAGETITL